MALHGPVQGQRKTKTTELTIIIHATVFLMLSEVIARVHTVRLRNVKQQQVAADRPSQLTPVVCPAVSCYHLPPLLQFSITRPESQNSFYLYGGEEAGLT